MNVSPAMPVMKLTCCSGGGGGGDGDNDGPTTHRAHDGDDLRSAARSEIGHNLESKRTAVYRNNTHEFGGAFTAVATAPSISARSHSDGFLYSVTII